MRHLSPLLAPRSAARPIHWKRVAAINDTHGACSRWRRRVDRLEHEERRTGAWMGWWSSARPSAPTRRSTAARSSSSTPETLSRNADPNRFQGRSVTDVYNALGVTAAALGNPRVRLRHPGAEGAHRAGPLHPSSPRRLPQGDPAASRLAASEHDSSTRAASAWGSSGSPPWRRPSPPTPALIAESTSRRRAVAVQEADLLRSRGADGGRETR